MHSLCKRAWRIPQQRDHTSRGHHITQGFWLDRPVSHPAPPTPRPRWRPRTTPSCRRSTGSRTAPSAWSRTASCGQCSTSRTLPVRLCLASLPPLRLLHRQGKEKLGFSFGRESSDGPHKRRLSLVHAGARVSLLALPLPRRQPYLFQGTAWHLSHPQVSRTSQSFTPCVAWRAKSLLQNSPIQSR